MPHSDIKRNRQNQMKNLIKSGKPAYGVSVQFPSAEIVEMIGELDFDWVMLDAEHGSITPDNIGPMIMAAEIRQSFDPRKTIRQSSISTSTAALWVFRYLT